MRWHRAIEVTLAGLVAGGCVGVGTSAPTTSRPTTSPPADVCAGVALEIGPDEQVAGSIATTVGAVRGLQKLPASPVAWPSLSADHAAVLCYIDGPIPKGPPPDANGSVPPSFDRGVYAVVDGESSLVEAGYRDSLPVVAP